MLLRNSYTNESYVYQLAIAPNERYNSDAPEEITDLLGDNTGFSGTRLNISTLDSGNYQIKILVCWNGGEYLVDTGRLLSIQGSQATLMTSDILSVQEEIDAAFKEISDSDAYDINNPYISVDPYHISPLTAIVIFTTENPASISVEIEGLNGAAPLSQNFDTITTRHIVPIYGLYANQATDITLTAHFEDSTIVSNTISITANSLPDSFLPINVIEADIAKMADGWTFLMAGSLQGYVYAVTVKSPGV